MSDFKQNMKNFFRIRDFLQCNGLEIKPTGCGRVGKPNDITRNEVVVGEVDALKIDINEPLKLSMFGIKN